MSSCTGNMVSPYNAVYSASKSYIRQFSRSIQYEYKNIDTTAFRPWHIATEMIGKPKSNLFMVEPEIFVESAMKHVGLTNEIDPYIIHYLNDWAEWATPNFISIYIKKKEYDEFESRKENNNLK